MVQKPFLQYFGYNIDEICRQSIIWQRSIPNISELKIFPLDSIRQLGLYPAGNGKAAIVDSCLSTFDILTQLEKFQGFTTWDWVMACYQTQGRGQYGRQWKSPLGNLCISQIIPCSLFSNGNQTLLPMLIATVFVRILKSQGFSVFLKWPNDIVLFIDDEIRKVGGLLLEHRQNSLRIGLGLNFSDNFCFGNLAANDKDLPVLQAASLPAPENLIEFWQDCSLQLQNTWQNWEENSKSELLQEIENNMIFVGSPIEFFEPDNDGNISCIRGVLLGLGSCGELLLETAKGRQKKMRGSLRPLFL